MLYFRNLFSSDINSIGNRTNCNYTHNKCANADFIYDINKSFSGQKQLKFEDNIII